MRCMQKRFPVGCPLTWTTQRASIIKVLWKNPALGQAPVRSASRTDSSSGERGPCRLRKSGRHYGRLLFLFEKGQELAVAFFFKLLDRNESQRGRVDAITRAALIVRTVVEHVPEMRIAFAAADFRSFHAERFVCFFGDVAVLDRFGEAGPSRAAVEFVERSEERFAADHIDIDSGFMIVPVFISKRRFGAALLGHAVLLGRKFLFQFVR